MTGVHETFDQHSIILYVQLSVEFLNLNML